MWMITPIGFFSVVQKPGDGESLTVRARVKSDLLALKKQFLPELGRIQESAVSDYRFRALAPRLAVARAYAQMVEQIDYDNFKSEVSSRQGRDRARLYHDVWSVLYRLQVQKSTVR